MDLNLRGSQINLSTRYKPKPQTIKYPPVNRPGSASLHRIFRSSPILRRPMSADNRFLNNCVRNPENILCENKLRRNKKYISKSSNLLKLLLDEPIKRPWLNKDCDDQLSDCSLGQQISDIAGRFSKCGDYSEVSSVEDDFRLIKNQQKRINSKKNILRMDNNYKKYHHTNQELFNDCIRSKEDEPREISYYQNQKFCSEIMSCTSPKLKSSKCEDFWHDKKPDLPGRVSFGQNDIYEIDVSDSENSGQPSTSSKENLTNNNKKSVHFDEAVEVTITTDDPTKYISDTNDNPGSESSHENPEKCFCSFSCNSTANIMPTLLQDSTEKNLESKKSPILDELENDDKKIQSELKNMSETSEQYFNYLSNNFREPTLGENGISSNEDTSPTLSSSSNNDQNNLSQNRNINQLKLPKEPNKKFILDDYVYDTDDKKLSTTITENSNSVLNNYIKVPSKKQNNMIANKSGLKPLKNQRSKSASVSKSDKSQTVEKNNYTCHRENSNLNEFQLDKVDSWMSLHDHCINEGRRSPMVNTFSQTSSPKSDTNNNTNNNRNDNDNDNMDDGSQDDSTSTYDEIVSVIKEIEEDKRKENPIPNQSNLDYKLQSILESDSPHRSNKTDTPDNMKDIMSYLEDIENSCEKTLMETRRSIPESSRTEIEFVFEPDISEDVPKISDLLALPNHQLARRIVALSLRSNELSNAIQLAREHVDHIRLEKQKLLRQEKQNFANRLKDQKKHYESIVLRHQGFIEQLLKDKGSLCEKITALTRRLDSQNQAWEHKLQTEMVRVKEASVAGEKIRRERWVRENTKKIKELTVKGLEAEINKMACDHQRQINELKKTHQQELLDAVEEARQKQEEMEKSLRESYAEDRETTISKERNAIRERFEKQLKDEQKSFDEQKNIIIKEFTAERERILAQMKQKDIEFENVKQDLIKDKELTLERTYSEFKESLQQQEQKYQTRINSIEKQFESDFIIWKREFENICKLREVENENAIRQHFRTERDRQIDAIVNKMDAESLKSQEEFETKLNRLKEKYEIDLRQADEMEKSLKEKYNETRNKLAESDAQVQNFQAVLKQMQIELNHSKKMSDQYLEEKEEMKENARKEVQTELNSIQAERDLEIQKIYKRVQQAIEKKDAALELLQKDNSTLRERCIKLEAIVRQQRKDYCIK